MIQKRLTAALARRIFRYDPKTGLLWWKEPGPKRNLDKPVGSRTPYGYLAVGVGRYDYLVHRVIWLIQTGRWPKYEIDHKDRNGTNNRWKNLREATPAQNKYNMRKRADNKSGIKGVHFAKREQKWLASISVSGRGKHLGYFDCPLKARSAYVAAVKELRGEFAHVE